jgi:hypothetical protein
VRQLVEAEQRGRNRRPGWAEAVRGRSRGLVPASGVGQGRGLGPAGQHDLRSIDCHVADSDDPEDQPARSTEGQSERHEHRCHDQPVRDDTAQPRCAIGRLGPRDAG